MMDILKEGLIGSLSSVYSIALIVIPLMIVLQIAKDYHVLNKLSQHFKGLTKLLGVSKDAILPLLVGVIFGISYGAGVIIQSSKEGDLTKKDLILLVAFLVTCHAVFEDTLLFVAVGANGYVLLGVRLLMAVGITYFLSKRINLNDLSELDKNKDLI
ncbi:nucleoside recognition domain-containing protein [Crassaminicella profunda]|uniref:nucleoside recognition domain-containing protein n=1 Tax=Crassaminicella profunda TaxID=1286698 RepID=UPI001CA65B76|nr:nucleoside recognition domain-containing protein [Crassaminicella profunda]QZY54680.1 nucleoside recognition protein [Crassaminicella profunda]